MTPPKPKELLIAIFCCGGSLHGWPLIRTSSHGPGIDRSRLSPGGAALSRSARTVNAASTAPAMGQSLSCDLLQLGCRHHSTLHREGHEYSQVFSCEPACKSSTCPAGRQDWYPVFWVKRGQIWQTPAAPSRWPVAPLVLEMSGSALRTASPSWWPCRIWSTTPAMLPAACIGMPCINTQAAFHVSPSRHQLL